MDFVCGLVVRKKDVQIVKSVLEENNVLHKHLKIRPHKGIQGHLIIPSILECDASLNAWSLPADIDLDAINVLGALGIQNQSPARGLIEDVVVVEVSELHKPITAFETGMMQAMIAADINPTPFTLPQLIELLPKSYSIYRPMLLLPFHTFHRPRWQAIMSMLESDLLLRDTFFAALAARMSVSHVAINAIIPASNISITEIEDVENVLRSPTNLQPIYGDFGVSLPAYPQHIPSSNDYAEAFWVSTKQNTIHQCWAPRYTMFSAGNVTEKARILKLPSVTAAVELGKQDGRGCAVVDLFAGIGYFAFSYVKAGCTKALCWDLNPWSIEGLKRGADMNRYDAKVLDFERDTDKQRSDERIATAVKEPSVRLIAFRESNQNALLRINSCRHLLPPIRHVNCGTLPTIGEAWKIAVEALDPQLGGHVHLHETCPESETSQRADHYIGLIIQYARMLQRGDNVEVHLDHIETVKSIGPRLLHIVFDIHVAFHMA